MECCFGKVNWDPHIAGYSSFTSGTGAHFLLHADIVKFLRDLSTGGVYDSLTDDALIEEINRCITTSQDKFKKVLRNAYFLTRKVIFRSFRVIKV